MITNLTSGGTVHQVGYVVQMNVLPPLCKLLDAKDAKMVIVILDALTNILAVRALQFKHIYSVFGIDCILNVCVRSGCGERKRDGAGVAGDRSDGRSGQDRGSAEPREPADLRDVDGAHREVLRRTGALTSLEFFALETHEAPSDYIFKPYSTVRNTIVFLFQDGDVPDLEPTGMDGVYRFTTEPEVPQGGFDFQ